MTERIHDDEPDTSERVVRALLAAECPKWAQARLEYLRSSGTDNAMWRIRLGRDVGGGAGADRDVVVRLPRRPQAAAGVLQEIAVLQQIETSTIGSMVATPRVRHVGQPHECFAHHWSVLDWIDGTDAWTLRGSLDGQPIGKLAHDLAEAVVAIRQLSTHMVGEREPGSRGGPLVALLERLDGWLDNAAWNAPALLDVDGVKRLAAQAREVVDEPVDQGFVHGDLIAGNLLVDSGRLRAIIDWGGAGRGDTAQDLAPAWSVLTSAERPAFRESVGVNDAAWIRGRTFELEHAVGGVLYYVPKRHPLGDVMTRTLDRLLADA